MSTSVDKLVDVVIPTYNSSEYIQDAINSVISQGRSIRSIYIVDDGSTDDTREVVRKIQMIDSRINYVKQTNKGPSSARNRGIVLGSAPYIAFLDADDVWKRSKIKKQLNVFAKSKYSELGVVYGGYGNINEKGKRLSHFSSFKLNRNIRGDVYAWIERENCIAGSDSAVLVKRECFEKVGLFDEKLGACEDWDMWLRISKQYQFDYVDSDIVDLRRHKREIQNNQKLMIQNSISFILKRLKYGSIISNIEINNIRSSAYFYVVTHIFDTAFVKYLFDPGVSSSVNINLSTFIKWIMDSVYKKFKLASLKRRLNFKVFAA